MIWVPAAAHDQNDSFTVRMMNGHVWPLIKWKPAVMHYSVGRLQIWNIDECKHVKTEWMDTGEQYKHKLKHQESCATEIISTACFSGDGAIMLKEKNH